MQKQVTFKIKGMQRDNSASAFSSEFAYENKNIRIVSTEENSSLSIVNEKGTKKITLKNKVNEDTSISGIIIGHTTIDKYIIIFSVSYTDNYIYKIYKDGNNFICDKIASGNFGFNIDYPIEAIALYENDAIQKVYWVDGKNQPRVLNIMDSFDTNSPLKLDFITDIQASPEHIDVSRINGSGSFAPGIIQYAFTYFNSYGQESNIAYVTPLHYISYDNRGGSPEDKINASFKIDLQSLDTSFEYIRIYSIHRTSIDSTPTVKRVVDIKTPSTGSTEYIDTGLYGDIIDPTELLYVGGEPIIAGTITHKDNTLFLGDIKTKLPPIAKEIKDNFKALDIEFTPVEITIDPELEGLKFESKNISYPQATGYYPYKSQLNESSYKFKTFKYLETYRFGIQVQHKTGKWSEPIFIKDAKNTSKPTGTFYEDTDISLTQAVCKLEDTHLNDLRNAGYIRIRPVIVYPSENERECICQGILCPTVYNVKDRYSNSPFAQSSWFARPNAPFNILADPEDWNSIAQAQNPELGSLNTIYSRTGITALGVGKFTSGQGGSTVTTNFLQDWGSWVEFRHNYPVPSNDKVNSEIQCLTNVATHPYTTNPKGFVEGHKNDYFIDQSILTLHSPDIEFGNYDITNAKLRIVGMVPLTSVVSDIDIQVSTPPRSSSNNAGVDKSYLPKIENNFVKNDTPVDPTKLGKSHFGWRGLVSGGFWKDCNKNKSAFYNFVVYPWHRNGSLNNQKEMEDNYRSAMLDKKKMSNLKYSYKTIFLNLRTSEGAVDERYNLNTEGVEVFNSNEQTLVKLKYDGKDINYYGNIDTVLTQDSNKYYPIYKTTDMEGSSYKNLTTDDGDTSGNDPVRIKYKSTPHAVITLKDSNILPTIVDDNDMIINPISIPEDIIQNSTPFWNETGALTIKQSAIPVFSKDVPGQYGRKTLLYGWLWLGELYRDNVENRFGGDSEEAIENNQWVPCGDPVCIDDSEKNYVIVTWNEGDTYYQRYDNLKTYPFTQEDQNSIVEIISFMCETRINLDGRYDRNRGLESNLAITPENFNKLNDVYSQTNNFFTYRGLNSNRIHQNTFPNLITWSKSKIEGELIDTWTNVTLASTLSLDGDKGKVRALKRFNNNLIAFQDKGISQILYNESTQIASTDGVPIEIANSGKVSGKRYISDNIGCTNKWSICSTPNGLYFIDSINKSIYLFNGELFNLSDRLGLRSWVNKVATKLLSWIPNNQNSTVNDSNIISCYDIKNKDVLFINDNECLAYSELLNQFTSFYSYKKAVLTTLEDKPIWLRNGELYLHNEGAYNYIFNTYEDFYTTVVVNPDILTDKTFSTVEFRSDVFSKDSSSNSYTLNTGILPFTHIKTNNEYQSGKFSFVRTPSALKRKFRIWRADIPRDSNNRMDRMRNPWLYVTLKSDLPSTPSAQEVTDYKTVLHDITVKYFE